MAKKEKQAKQKKDSSASPNSLAGMPGVPESIAYNKARGSLAGMALAGLVAFTAGSSTWWIIAWALIGGIAAGLITWWVSVILWRMALSAEYAGRRREALEASQTDQ